MTYKHHSSTPDNQVTHEEVWSARKLRNKHRGAYDSAMRYFAMIAPPKTFTVKLDQFNNVLDVVDYDAV